MLKTRIFLLLATFAFSHLLMAQPAEPGGGNAEPPATPEDKNEPIKQGFWQATLPGGTYVVSLDRITSVSRHSYLLDGALVVDEVTVDTLGQALARFYFIMPVGTATSSTAAATIIERGKGLLDAAGQRAGLQVDNMVIKKYPETTHARTIEYRLETAAQLTALFSSAKDAWQSGRGGQFKIQTK